jgi:hypothetical protein
MINLSHHPFAPKETAAAGLPRTFAWPASKAKIATDLRNRYWGSELQFVTALLGHNHDGRLSCISVGAGSLEIGPAAV